jgi:KDO2-lipid IV(A) lauroyltransferase
MESTARIQVIRSVWDNLGRNCTEFPHLETFKRTDSGPGWELSGGEHLDDLRKTGAQALFFSGHFGNWEMVLPIASQLDMTVSGFYRAASNRGVNDFIQSLRQKALAHKVFMFAKGGPGARAALLHLARGGRLGLLVDQKMNDGIPVPFFGQTAMTAPALAQFALRFQVPIMPVHIVRLGPARFRMVCDPPLAVALTGVKDADVYALTLAMNVVLEGWIREDPASWLWLHRRWPKHALPASAH